MAICYGSPYGTIIGPIGNLTFFVSRGKQFVRLRQNYSQLLEEKPIGFQNTSKILALVMKIYGLLKPEFYKYWKTYNKNSVETSQFLYQNMGYLFQSLPDKKQPLSKDNWINLSEMRLVYGGRLSEPKMQIENLTYDSNRLHLEWHTGVWKNGAPDDIAHIIAIYCVPVDKDALTSNCLYTCQPDVPPEIFTNAYTIFRSQIPTRNTKVNYEIKIFYGKSVRNKGEASMLINEGLNPKFLSTFLFFSNGSSYSDISGVQLFSHQGGN
ncbi:MAG: hypothetical protein WC614_00275 [bacterium]